MKISIIIPAYNEELQLYENLSKIKNSFELNGFLDYEIIVCDNNSSDKTSIIAHEFGARVIFEPFNQIAKARNTGASIATGEWLVFIDADSWPSKYLINLLLKQINSDNSIAGSSLVQFVSSPLWWRATWKFSNISMPLLHLTPTGAFMFCKRSAFNAVGGFNEDIFVLEDLDFSYKMHKYSKSYDKKFTVIKEPIYTSSRRSNNLKPKDFVKIAVNLSTKGKSSLKDKSRFQQWYSR